MLADAMESLQGSDLLSLHIDSLVHRYTMSVLITQWHTRYFKNTSIVTISAQYNRIEAFCEGALDNMPDTLEYVDLFANPLGFGRYFKDLGKLKSLKKLTVDGRFWASPPPYVYPPTVPRDCQKTPGVGDRRCENGWTHEMDVLEAWRPDFMIDTRTVSSLRQDSTRTLTFVLPPNLQEFKSRCTQLYYQLLEISPWLTAFRWKLRYLYYASRLKYRRQHNEEDSFEFDAFVSYASEDNDFVHGELVERLEERAGLRLNVHNRDWIPGRPIPSNIVAAVQSSRRTLVVLTRHLLESDWCQYEMQMATMEAAHSGRDVLLFLLYEDVPSHELPRQVLYNLQASTYILYPSHDHADSRLVDSFWQRLAQAIRD
ncbi:hypothetical protein BaRGS_00007761 [Batillaria attramentaria]|uniref:TIR domain-containing protein n=1 Tax=Batillaria attramentaria TaxID=370345 RepID=A0ABD0LNL7_9CAEN